MLLPTLLHKLALLLLLITKLQLEHIVCPQPHAAQATLTIQLAQMLPTGLLAQAPRPALLQPIALLHMDHLTHVVL